MANDPSYLDPSDPDNFGDMGRYNSPNPMLEKLLDILGNFSRTARPAGGEDAYGSFMRRELERNMVMQVQRDVAVNNQATNFFGINSRNPMVNGLGMLFGDPSGGYGQAMKMLTGSNPMAANSIAYGGGTGAMMGAFGRIGHVGTGEISQANSDFMNSAFYNHRTINQDYVNNLQNSINQQSAAFTKLNPNIAAAYGLSPGQSASGSTSLQISDSQLNQLQIATNAMQKAGGDKNKIQGIADDFAKSAGATLDKIVEEYKSKNNGVLDAGVMARIGHDLQSNGITSAAYGLNNLPKAGSKIFGGVDYAISRGYSEEEAMSMFNRAGQLQLLGNHPSYLGARDSAIGQGNLEKAASAFRPIGKAMGMNEIDAMNQLLGPEAADLSSSAGADKIAKLGRDVTATARVAGIGIKSLVGMISTMRDLAAQNPELAYMGSGVAQMVLNETKRAQALNATLTPEQSRMAGGVQGLTNQGLSVASNGMMSGAGKIIGNSLALAKYKGIDISSDLDAYQGSSQSGSDYHKFVTGVSSKLGVSPYSLSQNLNNDGLAASAAHDLEIARRMQEGVMSNIGHTLDRMLAPAGLSSKDVSEAYAKDPYSVAAMLATKASGGRLGGAALQSVGDMLAPGSMSNTYLQQWMQQTTPGYKEHMATVNRMVQQESEDSEIYDRHQAASYATPLQNIVNSVVSGNVTSARSAFDAFRNSYYTSSTPGAAGRTNAIDAFINASSGKGGATAGDVAKLFSSMGMSDKFKKLSPKDQASAITALQNALSTGDKRKIDKVINGNEALTELASKNGGLDGDALIDAVKKGGMNGMIAAGIAPITAEQQASYKNDYIDSDNSYMKKGIAAIGDKGVRDYLQGMSPSDLRKALDKSHGSISDLLSNSGKKFSDQAVQDAVTQTGAATDAITSHEQGRESSSQQAEGTKDPMTQILDLLTKFLGEGRNSIAGSITNLSTTIASLQ